MTRRAARRRRGRPPGLHVLVPPGLREADLRLFRRVAGLPAGPVDRIARGLSTAANHSVLWLGAAGLVASGGRTGRRAALRGLASLSLASAFVNLPAPSGMTARFERFDARPGIRSRHQRHHNRAGEGVRAVMRTLSEGSRFAAARASWPAFWEPGDIGLLNGT